MSEIWKDIIYPCLSVDKILKAVPQEIRFDFYKARIKKEKK